MRIGIDCHILGKQKGGVETSVEVLVRELARHDTENTYFLYVSQRHPFQPGELPANFLLKPLWSASPLIGRLFLLPYGYFRDGLDVLHVQRAAPFFGCRNTLVHMHDAMYSTHPDLFPFWKRLLMDQLLRWSGRRARLVLTPTAASKQEIARHYGIDPAKIHVLPAPDLEGLYPAKDPGEVEPVLREFGVQQPYVAFLGAMERNKNVHVLLDAFAEFAKAQPRHRLVLIGKWRTETRAGYVDELERQIARLSIADKVVRTGWVSKEQRRLLLCGAAMLVFPSAAEGFGIPPLEGMACGIPVIASDLPPIREYYGQSVLPCRPGDSRHLAERMAELAANEVLARDLTAAGAAVVSRERACNRAPYLVAMYRKTAGQTVVLSSSLKPETSDKAGRGGG